MSYELVAILTVGLVLGFGQIATMIYAIQGFKEMHRIQRALGGLVVQESERLQALLRSTS
jgi:hypothetical protein